MAAVATLLQGLTLSEARSLAAKEIEALESKADLDASVGALADALPALEAKAGVAPILPDIAGEGAILSWFGPDGGPATGGVDATARIIAAARASVGKASATLARTAQDFAEAGHVEPVRWLEALAGAPETDLGALMEIADALPQYTITLREMAVTLHLRIAETLRGAVQAEREAGPGDQLPSILARSLKKLGNRLSDLGRREEALTATQEAVDICHRLAGVRPEAFLPDLAMSLNNLGNRLSDLGRRERALAATLEAVDICRRLADLRPEAFLPNLPTSFNNLGNRLSDLGRREQALAPAQESVDIRRRLADALPDTFLPDLASSLNNLGNVLSDLGREEALAPAQEGTDIYRRLADARPDAFLPDLARSLNNLGDILSDLARHEKALAAAQEATDIYRRLADARPDAFLPDLAISLNSLGDILSDLGRHEEALAAAQGAIATLSPLFLRLPAAYWRQMATMTRRYRERSKTLGVEPDSALVTPIAEVFRKLEAAPRGSNSNA